MGGVNNATRTLTDVQVLQVTQLLDSILQGETPQGAIDGINQVYTLSFNYKANSTILTRNGVLQVRGVEYTESGPAEITTETPLEVGEVLFVQYKALED